ncbi:MAG: hypothetical protein IJL00_04890, partial [Clostridia bacterium]|nr:hypothetical protein [Clostridia bacterium]
EIVPEDPFYNFFTHSAAGTAQLPLADTIVDMATAFFVTIFTGIVLYIVLRRREKKEAAVAPEEKAEKATAAV